MEQDYQGSQHEYEIVDSDEESLLEEYSAQEDQVEEEAPPVEVEAFSKSQVAPLETIYILFSFFKKECAQIAGKYNCKVRFSIDSYIVEQTGECSKQKFGLCLEEMYEFMKSIKAVQLKGEGEAWNKLKYYYSPYIVEMLAKKNIRLTLFHSKVYGFSREAPLQAIKNQLTGLVKNMIVHCLSFRRVRESYAKNNSWVAQVYKHVSAYLQLVLEHYYSFFKERQLVVCIGTLNTHLIIHGYRAKFLMEAKATLRNVLESMVCLFIRDTHIQQKTLSKFLKKASLFPVYSAPHNQHTTVIISKDNILKQLLIKSASFMKYLGLEDPKEASFSDSTVMYEPGIGFYLIPSSTINIKIDKIKERCQVRSYDTYTHLGIRHFKKIFIKQGTERQNHFKDLMLDLILCVEEFKQKFELMKPQEKKEQPIKEVDDGLKYQILSGKASSEELSSALKRDVLVQKLRMKKKFMIAYNVVETKEESAYWKVGSDGQEGAEVSAQSMNKGSYLRGHKKVSEKGDQVVMFQQLITIL